MEICKISSSYQKKTWTWSQLWKTVLNEFDPDIGQRILSSAKNKKIKIYDESTVQSIKKYNKSLLVSTSKTTIVTDLVIFAIGRIPNISSLNLDNAKIKLTSQGAIKVSKLSQTNIKNIFALGDVTNRKNLTPVAIREAVHLVNYFLYRNKIKDITQKLKERALSFFFFYPFYVKTGYFFSELY